MKHVFSLLLIASIVACNKKTDNFVPSNSIEGNWDWVSTYTGWGGLTDTSSGTQQKLDFSSYKSYSWTKNDTIIHSGNYVLQFKQSAFTNKKEWILNADGITNSMILTVNKDTMWLMEEATDGATHRFLKAN